MDVLVVYESSYGNTHLIAEAIAEGLGGTHTVDVVPVAKATQELVDRANLVVVGGPTHIHGMSRPATREKAAEAAHQPGSPLVLDADAEGPGLREWFENLRPVNAFGAAFDTRIDASALITGRASKGISKQLRRHDIREIADPMSFLVTKETHLAAGQQDAARRWGELLADALADHTDPSRAN
ncbi:MAG TPA: flavodoxin domain-containing protein [Nakamurella sp.]